MLRVIYVLHPRSAARCGEYEARYGFSNSRTWVLFLMYQSQRPRGKLARFWGNATDEVISLQHLGNSVSVGNHSSSAAYNYIIRSEEVGNKIFF